MKIVLKDFLLIPNILSIIRILCAFPLYILIKKAPPAYPDLIPTLIVCLIIIITDFLDGFIARKYRIISELGKILDPLGDKIITITGIIALFVAKRIPLDFLSLIVLKDILIFAGGIIISKKNNIIVSSNNFGKWASSFLAFGLTSYILSPSFLQGRIWTPSLIFAHIMLILGIIFIFLSLASYLNVFIYNMKKSNNPDNSLSKTLKTTIFTLLFSSSIFYIIAFYLPFAKATFKAF